MSGSSSGKSGSLLSDHPLVVIVGVAAAAIAIFAFVTGVVDLPSLFSPEARLQRSLVGSWQEPGGGVLTFYENGTMEEVGGFIPVTGYYYVTDRDRVTIQPAGILGIAGNQVWQVTVTGNTLRVNNLSFGDSFTATKIR